MAGYKADSREFGYLIRYLKSNHLCEESSLSSDGINEFNSWLDRQPNSSAVLLIDEYDAPLTASLNDPVTFHEVKQVLASLYTKLKRRSRALRFLFVTGVTNLNNASVIPDLNILQDISLVPELGELVGFTQKELNHYFHEYIRRSSITQGITEEKLLDELIANYGGFCFEETAREKVFSPSSVLNFFKSPQSGFKNYWSEVTNPFLLQYLKGHSLPESPE